MIVLFTDFGATGPYVGQMKAAIRREAPHVEIIDLFADAPAHDPRASAYLLAAYVDAFPSGSVFLCVVDPGVGGLRAPGILRADGRWFVGPENRLFEPIVRRAAQPPKWWRITWRPETLSASFHGRDLFAPVAARLTHDQVPPGDEYPIDDIRRPQWPDDLAEIVYIDGFGNAMTGVRASTLAEGTRLRVGGVEVGQARTFSDVPTGNAFWYENANGLAEVAVNLGRADSHFGLRVGDAVDIVIP